MKTLLRRAIAMIALIAFVATLLPPSAFAEARTSFVRSQIDSRPAKPNSEATEGIEIVPHKTDNPERSGIWDGSIATGFAGGNGTQGNPYLISDGSELAFLARKVNNGKDYSGVYFKLTNDIYLNNTNNWASWGNGVTPQNEWVAIGIDNSFYGCFDGNGYAVHGIYINEDEQNCLGLFGKTGGDSIIANLGVAECYICGFSSVGGIVGDNERGTVSNCYNSGSVIGNVNVGGVVGANGDFDCDAAVVNCYNIGSVIGEDFSVGGVVGYNLNGSITNCYNTGNVTSTYGINGGTGGVVGCITNGTVTNCYNTGIITGICDVGGVVGENNNATEVYVIINTIITNCYNTGNVIGDSSVGGVVGSSKSMMGDVTNCYNTGNVSGDSYVGGVVGVKDGWYDYDYSGDIINCYNIGDVTGSNNVGGVIGDNKKYDSCYITNCYYSVGCCSNGNSYGIALTSQQLLYAENYEGFDFISIWTMGGNPDYPYPELVSNIHAVTTKPGDANGDGNVTIADATLIARMALNLTESVPAADFNGDGSISMADATLTARKALNLI